MVSHKERITCIVGGVSEIPQHTAFLFNLTIKVMCKEQKIGLVLLFIIWLIWIILAVLSSN